MLLATGIFSVAFYIILCPLSKEKLSNQSKIHGSNEMPSAGLSATVIQESSQLVPKVSRQDAGGHDCLISSRSFLVGDALSKFLSSR